MKKLFILSITVFIAFISSGQIINTIAGNGINGCGGDGEHALNAQFISPMDIVTDVPGNIYITDYDCQVIRKVNIAGIITTIAGTGVAGSSGDNGPAIDARLNHPTGIDIDIDGNIVFVDRGNQSVRRINHTTGIITLLASGLNGPVKLACGPSGNIYVANLNGVIYKIDYITGILSTIFTSASPILSVAVDNDENIFYGTTNQRIYHYNQTTGISSLYAGGGSNPDTENIPALVVAINYPYDLDIDNQGNLIYLDAYNYRIRKIDRNTNLVNTIAGNGNGFFAGDGGLAINASFASSEGIYVDNCNNLYFADYSADRIRKVTIDYTPATTPSLTAQAICSGGTANIEISGTLNDATEWKLYSFGCGSIAEGSTSGNSISVTPVQNTLYYVRGEGACVLPGVCSNITIQVINDPAFIAHPAGAFICAGNTHTMSVSASGGTPALLYQWQASENGTDWNNIEDATGNSLTTPNLTQTIRYRCRVSSSGEGCDVVYSNDAIVGVTPIPTNDLCVNALPVISFPYNSGVVSNSCSMSDIPPTSGCDGYSNNLWFVLTGTGNIITASTMAQLTNFDTEIHVYTGECTHLTEITCNDDFGSGNHSFVEWCSLLNTTYFISVGSNNPTGENGNFILSISDFPLSPPFNVSTSPITICLSGNAILTAMPGTNGNSVLWYSDSCGEIYEGSGNTFSINPSSDINYFAQTHNTLCPESSSECVQVTINVADELTFTQQPDDQEICSGGSCQLTVLANGGTPAITYQWQLSQDNISYTDIINANASDYNTISLSETTYYRCVIDATGVGCEQVVSDFATIAVQPDPIFTVQPQGAVVCSGDFHTMIATAVGGTPALSMQWQVSDDGYSWENIANENTNTYTTDVLTATSYFRCVANSSGIGCNQAVSNMAVVNVQDLYPPVPDITELELIEAECSVEITVYPSATDNCDGPITASTESELFYDEQGSYFIIWQYTDAWGNIAYQSQSVIISDQTIPVPDVTELPDIVAECNAVIETVPVAHDNCSGEITATTSNPIAYDQQGTFYVTWAFSDGNGNIAYQVQTVIVDDVTTPEITCGNDVSTDAMPNHYYLVNSTDFDPVFTDDNCSIESVINDFNNTSTLFGSFLPEGINVISWTVTDIGNNTQSCTITITVNPFVGTNISTTNGFLLYPNPSEGCFSVILPQGQIPQKIIITDYSGKKIVESSFSISHINKFNFNLKEGLYLVNVFTDTEHYIEKLIILF